MSEPLVEELLGRAFHAAAAAGANEAIELVRRNLSEGDALSYEAVLPERDPMKHLSEVVLPRLVYFLDCRGAPLPAAPGVFVSLFAGDRLYFLHPKDVLDVLSRATGISIEEMVRRFGEASAR